MDNLSKQKDFGKNNTAISLLINMLHLCLCIIPALSYSKYLDK